MIAPLLATGFPVDDPQAWVVTAITTLVVGGWILRAFGPRSRKPSCGSCAPPPPKSSPPEPR